MSKSEQASELIEFPCHYEFKAFGPGGDEQFADAVQVAISKVIPVSRDAMKSRASSSGKYQCVSAMMSLQSRAQLEAVYAQLRKLDNLKYLL